ncbi:hypothetical protein Bca101_083145 [Brassica carinata]
MQTYLMNYNHMVGWRTSSISRETELFKFGGLKIFFGPVAKFHEAWFRTEHHWDSSITTLVRDEFEIICLNRMKGMVFQAKRGKAHDQFGLEIHCGKICAPSGLLMQPRRRVKPHQTLGTLTVMDLGHSSTS